MSQTLAQIIELAGRGEIKISDHGYDELAEDGIFVRDIVSSLPDAELLAEIGVRSRHSTVRVDDGAALCSVARRSRRLTQMGEDGHAAGRNAPPVKVLAGKQTGFLFCHSQDTHRSRFASPP